MTDVPRRFPALLPLVLGIAATALAAAPLRAGPADGTPARPIVAGFERFHTAEGTDPVVGGRLLLGELNCAACHKGAGGDAPLAPVARKQAPILDEVGSRVKLDHLRAYLADPRGVKPGTTMPNLLDGLPKEEAEATVDALVHFLATTGTTAEKPTGSKRVEAGRALYAQTGCAACHGLKPGEADALATTVPIGPVAAKYTTVSLGHFLENPLRTRPSGRMPGMNLAPGEAQAVAAYLFRDAQVEAPPRLAYRYYEGEWTKLPDLDKLEPIASGMAHDLDLAVAHRKNAYAIRFEGTLPILRDGGYQFHLASDDGSRLAIDGRDLILNDGIHPTQEKSSRTRLRKGDHKVVVDYFDGGGQAILDLEYEGSGLDRRSLADDLVPSDPAQQRDPATSSSRFTPDPVKVERGRELFASIGCASCHQLREDGRAIASKVVAPPLESSKPEAGCLAATVAKGLPDYHLSPRQKLALAAAFRPETARPTEKEAVSRTFLAFACTTCHQRDGVGGVEPERDPAFATTQKEMGEEGRIPPNLSGVGGKLTREWLAHVLADGAKDRPYMLTRMPKFGEGNVGHLAQPLEGLDPVPPVAAVEFDVPAKRVKANGRFMVGNQAFNCGACHKFKEFESNGIQALDMTMMTRRLRRDWFTRYVINPQQYRPGTRMPASWPDGKSQLESIFGGDTAKQVESVWAYLSDGPDAAVPYGLGREPIPLVADKAPVIYRNFIQGAGSRAIGVGYPEKANLAFDANDLRLALIWQGAFIDASRHWVGRGVGYEGPLGDNILPLAAGSGFASLANESDPWPANSAKDRDQRFRGYRLTKGGKPAFLYTVGTVEVDDFPEAVAGKEVATIRRTIELRSEQAPTDLFFRAASGRSVRDLGGGWYLVDGEWKLRLDADSPPIVRQVGGKAELIVPVRLKDGKGRIVEEFAW